MTNIDTDKVLEVLNGLEIVEEGPEGYILVENSQEVHEKLNALGVASETINKYGDGETFCIIALAFTEGYASDFIDGKLQKDKWIEQTLAGMFEVENFEKLGKENDHIFQALVFLGEASSKLSLARTILKNNKVAVEPEKMKEMLNMQTWVHDFSQYLRSIEKDSENALILGQIGNGPSFDTIDTNRYFEQFNDLKKKQGGELKGKFNDILGPLNLNDSKILLASIMKHSHLLLQKVNGLKSAYFNELNYMQAVNFNVSRILENAPHMLIDRYFSNANHEFYINEIKETIIEYLLFLKLLNEHVQIFTFENINPAYPHHLKTLLNFDLENHFLPSIK